ncbi:MAG: regulatory protein RecX [Eubacteriales bacterium]|nr:regulatory protein RecX [Lachnospiraceae bacterium]MDO5126868.1 regulatory protein RecX [Eubacteriales bacterium]
MNHKENKQNAFDKATDYLSYCDRTEKEVRAKLIQNDYSEAEILSALNKLKEYGYVDDARYAKHYQSLKMNKLGVKRIKMELIQKGVDNTVIEQVINSNPIDEVTTIIHILERRFSNACFEDEKEQRRIYAYFVRRGFQFETIKHAVHIFVKNNSFQ